MKRFYSALILALAVVTARPDSVVVFNEIMYHPRFNESLLEWVELHNQNATDVDLSGWSIRGGIDYFFPEGTIISAGSYVVVALSPAVLTNGTTITNVFGPFAGRLSNAGEKLELRNNNNREVDSITYGVDGNWPTAADGAGPSLAKFNPDTASDVASNWRASAVNGGSPGKANQAQSIVVTSMRTLVPFNSTWRYEQSGTDLGSAWIAPGFNDSAWPTGQGVLADETCGCLPERILTQLTVGANKPTFYFRSTFVYTGNVASAVLSLRHILDDGMVVYLNGSEVYRLGVPAGPVTFSSLADRAVGEAVYEGPFPISSAALVYGTNHLAVEVHQQSAGSTDVAFALQLDETLTTTNAPSTDSATGVTVAFNEVSSVTNAQFWIELVNFGTQSVVLDNFVLARFGTTNREYVLPALTIPAGGFAILDRATLGFGADPGDLVVLYTPGQSNAIDGVIAKSFSRARWPEATGKWLRPSVITPGTANQFVFHDEIVINEILPEARPLPATPAVLYTNTLLSYTNTWRYNQTGITNIDPSWVESTFDDGDWLTGRGVFYTNISSALPAPKGSTLALSNGTQPIVTYYFRTEFIFTNSLVGAQLVINHIVDDGAIFYLNGVEVLRYSLPAGPINASTRALTNIGVPVVSGPNLISSESLVNGTNILTVELHQYAAPPITRDVAFAAELLVTGIVVPAEPARDSTESWLELFNRSAVPVSLDGWKLGGGISYDFPSNTTILPGGYLVIAKDLAVMQAKYPALPVLGPFSGQLGNSDHVVLEDSDENPADEVRYFNKRPWPQYLRGFGHSLELRDPDADNSKPEAWAYSDQSSLAGWQTNIIRGVAVADPANSPTQWNEFIMGLLGEGEVLIDNVSVIETPLTTPRQLLQNGSFESGTNSWRLIGNHRLSRVVADPSNPANKVLRLIAQGDTEHRHNQVSTTFTNNTAIVNGRDYEISFRSKWIAGCNRLNTRLYFNRLARTTQLSVPAAQGTPGAANSRLVANIGPTFGNLRHTPLVPSVNQPVVVSADTSDPDSVTNATLFYSVNGGPWSNVLMSATASTSGLKISGTIPPQGAGALVQFHLEATDGLGVSAFYPAGGTNSRALYKVAPSSPVARLHNIRLLMPAADATLMHASTNVMSNEPYGVTVVYNDREFFYDATMHLQGSQRGRDNPTRVGYTVDLPGGQMLRGGLDGFTIDRSGGYSGKGGKQDEILIKHAINRAGRLPGMYDDLCQVWAPRSSEDSTGLLILEKYGDEFLDSAFDDGSKGEAYKLELIYYPTTTANGDVQGPKLPQPDVVLGTDIKDLGNDPEAYRWVNLKDNRVARDNYAPMVKLAQTMSLSGTNFDSQIRNVMDVDEWLRYVALISLIGGTDIYPAGNLHNLIIYFRPEDEKAMAFPWDMDFSFTTATNAALAGTGSPNTTKLFANAHHNRLFYNHLYDLSLTTGDAPYMARWASHYGGLVGQGNWQAAVTFLADRASYVRNQTPTNIPFAIANNSGNNFATSNNTVVLSGTAPITVRDIYINGILYTLTWTSLSNWTLTLPLPAYTNTIAVQGYDARGRLLGSAADSIVITNLGQLPLLPVVINEWMAANAAPGGFPEPLSGQFEDWIELFNPNLVPFNLGGYFLTDTLAQPTKWMIPSNTVIGARGYLLVWADSNPALNNTTNSDLHTNFRLSNSGEAIGLFAPDGSALHTITFSGQIQNYSQGLYPDGNIASIHFMPNWTPRTTNELGDVPSPAIDARTVSVQTNTFTLQHSAVPNRLYRIEYKTSLDEPTWTPLTTVRAFGNGITISDSMAAQSQRFYRAVLVP